MSTQPSLSPYIRLSTSTATLSRLGLLLAGIVSGLAIVQASRYLSSRSRDNRSTRAGYISTKEDGRNGVIKKEDEDEEESIVDDEEEDEVEVEHVADPVPVDESQNLLTLLYSIAEDQARKEGYVHRSITCNHCGTSPIRGYRYKCANCVDYDVCELCEAQDIHFKTHVFVKIRVPIPPLMNPRSALLGAFYPGKDFTSELPAYDLAELQRISHFDIVELEAFHDQFLSLSTAEGGIDRETFERCLGPLGLEKNLIIERIFMFFDRDGNGIINFEELVMGLSVLCKGGLDERMKWAFKGYDLNNDGIISREELHQMFKAYFHLSMELVRDVVKTMEEGMMESFDDEATKPVSAAFAAPGSSSSSGNQGEEDEEDSGNKHVGKKEVMDVYGSFAAGTERSVSYTSPSTRSPRRPSIDSASTRRTLSLRRSLPHLSTSSPLRMSLDPSSPHYHSLVGLPSPVPQSAQEEQWPVMEAMSQDAIEEMVEKTFALAGLDDDDEGLSFEDFKRVVEVDSNLLAWFEALGSVF
ncbi:uncharacterized protein SPPG_04973 [Spizellomyces punctatus DAOM BR117]|uniref:Calmodulin n=1 Tax=Spizellomyces punctatus (strain DAOM BR117) TaxID=645134 RepID=A0A0L0HDR0_SPIPD|nr:uncharacterized protein SPPG_04973 [Spizellomyces punctatus DAOM BR117]KNC99585.1 hypothetical protein SPPG_04973 [Spizellomyces punctatus DAOM BR117]|eukprot:XP_016607625.1 hypothetical protein SPPG_04973 [Spizellomyces punctatus DAOM BR117]